MPQQIARDPRKPSSEYPTYWFVLLERALDDGDFAAALRAQRQLRRLGVEVTYRRKPWPDGEGGGDAA